MMFWYLANLKPIFQISSSWLLVVSTTRTRKWAHLAFVSQVTTKNQSQCPYNDSIRSSRSKSPWHYLWKRSTGTSRTWCVYQSGQRPKRTTIKPQRKCCTILDVPLWCPTLRLIPIAQRSIKNRMATKSTSNMNWSISCNIRVCFGWQHYRCLLPRCFIQTKRKSSRRSYEKYPIKTMSFAASTTTLRMTRSSPIIILTSR